MFKRRYLGRLKLKKCNIYNQINIIPEVEIIEAKDENKESNNDRIFCSFCGSTNVLNVNFCHSCGKSISLDSKDFRESKKEYANNKAGILKYQGLFQILIGLHGLFVIVFTLSIVLSEFKTKPIESLFFWCFIIAIRIHFLPIL